MNRYFAIIPAAGSGERFGSDIPKQFLTIDGVSILERSVAPFLQCELIQKVVVVINEKDLNFFDYSSPATGFQSVSTSPAREVVNRTLDEDVSSSRGEGEHKKILTAPGGQTRMASVMNGIMTLQDIASDDDWVLVHDSVRPFLSINDIAKLINIVGEHPVGGILGVPVKDTLKKINDNGEIVSTVDRTNLWHAFTPQMFRYGLLKKALIRAQESNISITDEAAALELLGYKPIIVQGNAINTKITFSEDLTEFEEV